MTRDEVKAEIMRVISIRGSSYQQPFPKQIHNSSLKFIAKEFYLANPFNPFKDIVGNFDTDMNRTKYRKIFSKIQQNPFAAHVLNAFYSTTGVTNWHLFLQASRTASLTRLYSHDYNKDLVKILIDLFYDAVGLSFKTLEQKFRTETVMNIIKNIRKTGDFSAMPILADALGDADFPEESILSHYRNPEARFSFGSWIFRASGINCKIKKTANS